MRTIGLAICFIHNYSNLAVLLKLCITLFDAVYFLSNLQKNVEAILCNMYLISLGRIYCIWDLPEMKMINGNIVLIRNIGVKA